MELVTARQVLGISAADDWSVIRRAYRDRVRRSHPDLAGPDGVDRTVLLNDAYRSLATARREGRLHDVVPDQRRPTPASPPVADPDAPRSTGYGGPHDGGTVPHDARLVDRDTVALSSTPDEAFRRLVEAAHVIGDVSYVDRSSSIFEAVVALDDGTHASLVVSLQWRAHDASCEAFCTLEALNRPAHLDVSGVLAQLMAHLPPDRDLDRSG